jgi:hypothetical protein
MTADALDAAKGILLGCVIGVAMWGVGFLIWWAW